jgi:PAS domain S-box-containing protein
MSQELALLALQAFTQGFSSTIIVDKSGKIVMINDQALRYLGLEPQNWPLVIGKHLGESLLHRNLDAVGSTQGALLDLQQAWSKVLKGELAEFKLNSLSPHGKMIVAKVVLKPIYNQSGRGSDDFDYVFIESHDVTSFYQMEAQAIEEKRLAGQALAVRKAIFDQSVLHLVLYDKDLCFVDASESSRNTMGLTQERMQDLVGKPFIETPWYQLLSEQISLVVEHCQLALSGQTTSLELSVVLPDGSPLITETTYSPVYATHGEVTHLLVESRDVTSDRQLRHTLEQANRSKSEFLSRMSHELRTPLNVILGYTELLGLDANDDQREPLDSILDAGKHLLSLINEVLDIARIEQGRLELQLTPVYLHTLLEGVLTLMQPLAQQYQVQLVLRRSAQQFLVLADAQRLRQVLFNLVSNAIKYNRPGGKVQITSRQFADQVRINVIDDGIGIPSEKIARLFVPFDRLGAENTGIEGSGVGLVLCKALLEAMSSQLIVQSEPDIGSTFCFELPILREMTIVGGDQDTMDAQKGQSGKKPQTTDILQIFYVEDNEDNIKLMENVIRLRENFRLMVFRTGNEALLGLGNGLPDVLLLDLNLPDMHGTEIMQVLRAIDSRRSLPIIVLSADATNETFEQVMSLGAKYFLTKPFALQDLFDAIDGVTSR